LIVLNALQAPVISKAIKRCCIAYRSADIHPSSARSEPFVERLSLPFASFSREGCAESVEDLGGTPAHSRLLERDH
jgi:hypothetical protein